MKFSSIVILLLAFMLSSCATTQNNHDPIAPVNRVTDTVNDTIDRVTLKPLAQGYTKAVPKPMRTAVSNFYDNATYINTVLNDFLQGKGEQGVQDFMRFLINTVLGIGGFVDVATSMGFERHEEDFGQTLATWGVSQGAYVIYPLLGPNSLRDTPDFLTATATDPLFWAGLVIAPYITIPVTALKYVDKRAQLLDASSMRDELALDPYVFTREAWRQNREFMIHDGHPPAPKINEDDDWEEDDWDEEASDSEDEGNNTAEVIDSEHATASTDHTGTEEKNRTSENSVTEGLFKNEEIEGQTDESNPSIKTRISLASTPPTDITLTPESGTVATAGSEIISVESDDVTRSAEGAIYSIYLSSHYSEVEAAAEQGKFAKLDIQTTIVAVTLDQHVWYRLLASEHSDKAEAFGQLKAIKSRTDLSKAWLEVKKK